MKQNKVRKKTRQNRKKPLFPVCLATHAYSIILVYYNPVRFVVVVVFYLKFETN